MVLEGVQGWNVGFCGDPFESIVDEILKGDNMYMYTKSWKTEACSARLQG